MPDLATLAGDARAAIDAARDALRIYHAAAAASGDAHAAAAAGRLALRLADVRGEAGALPAPAAPSPVEIAALRAAADRADRRCRHAEANLSHVQASNYRRMGAPNLNRHDRAGEQEITREAHAVASRARIAARDAHARLSDAEARARA